MSPQPKKPNGTKNRPPIVCPHSDLCAAPQVHGEVMSGIDDMRTAVGELLEEHGRLIGRIEQVHNESLERARIHAECNDQILTALRRLEERLGDDSNA